MADDMVQEVVQRVIQRLGPADQPVKRDAPGKVLNTPGLTEFVGATELGDTIGLVIASLDANLHKQIGIDPRFRSLGILSARTGAGPQILAADEGVKATNTEVLAVEFPRDTKGGAGHGSLIIFGAEEVSDARRAVEVALRELPRTFGDVYANEQGHLEFQYTARASHACHKALGAEVGKAYGLVLAAPAGIGVVICDVAVKSANVDVLSYLSPGHGTSFSNEFAINISGDSGAVRQAIIAAREAGIKLLGAWGQKPTSVTTPYI